MSDSLSETNATLRENLDTTQNQRERNINALWLVVHGCALNQYEMRAMCNKLDLEAQGFFEALSELNNPDQYPNAYDKMLKDIQNVWSIILNISVESFFHAFHYYINNLDFPAILKNLLTGKEVVFKQDTIEALKELVAISNKIKNGEITNGVDGLYTPPRQYQTES